MIEDLLRFCRLTRGAPSRHRIDLNTVTHRVIHDLQVADPQRRIEVRIAPLPECAGEPSLIEQVMSNLLSNAFKFTRDRDDAMVEVGTCRVTNDGREEEAYFVRGQWRGFQYEVRRQALRCISTVAYARAVPGNRRRLVHREAHTGAPWRSNLGRKSPRIRVQHSFL